MSYFGRILTFAARGFVLRTDGLQIVAAAAVPGIAKALGVQMPETLGTDIAAYIAFTVLTWAGLRLICAPYFLWKDDQTEITRLKTELQDPRRRQIEALRSGFIDKRVNLVNNLTQIIVDIRRFNELGTDGGKIVEALYPEAIGFAIDRDFRLYWETFKSNALAWNAVRKYGDSVGAPSLELRAKMNARCAFHITLANEALGAMVRCLGYDEGHRAEFIERYNKTIDLYRAFDLDFSFAAVRQVNLSHIPLVD